MASAAIGSLNQEELQRQRRIQARIGALSLLVVSLIGLVAFLAPFWVPFAAAANEAQLQTSARAADSPLITILLSVGCVVVLFANLGPALSSKAVALLGVLIGINVVLRMVDLSFLPPGEFSPIFLLIMLVGYCYGAQMGFLMGALTLLCSAFLTGGIGPWLPFQMMTAGWMGLTASWLRVGRSQPGAHPEREVLRLVIFGFAWGLLYGAIINLYYWPLMTNAGAMYFAQGDGLGKVVEHYALFYLVQSLPADLTRALGNAALLLVLGAPLLKVFYRFRARFDYQVVEATLPG